MARMLGPALAGLALFIINVDAHAEAPVCTPAMTPNQCVEAQLKAAADILGKYKAETARLEAEINALKNAPKAQVGMIPCHKTFTIPAAPTNPLTVDFNL